MNTKILYKSFIAILVLMMIHSDVICQTQTKTENNQQAKVNYTSFTVNAEKQKIMIDWSTDNKVATNYFEIQRSIDGTNFKTIELVMGPDPKHANCDCYVGFDKLSNIKHKYFYRLKHVGTDGEIELSETRMLAINK